MINRPWLVVQHTPTEGPGLLAGVMDEAGAGVVVARLDRGDPLPELNEVAGAVVMGGPMGVHDSADFPWLTRRRPG